MPEPTFERATVLIKTSEAHVGLPTEAPKSEGRSIDWVMQDAQDIEELPAGVRAALAGCMVPRSPGVPNVISGEFKQAGETDLAVLCVRGPHAAVYVFWGDAPGGSEAGLLSRLSISRPAHTIRTAPAADIGVDVRRELPIEPGMPTRIRHDGIQLGGGCCATTYYWHRGRWRAYGSIELEPGMSRPAC